MSTPISSPTAYCDVAHALMYVDARQWGDLLKDDNTREAASAIPSDAVIAELLLAASGEIESAVLKGDRYVVADLQALTGAGAAALRELTAVLAWVKCWRRRKPMQDPPAWATWVYDQLDALANGQRIFALQEAADSGGVHHTVETAQDVTNRDLLTTQAERFFGVRSNRRCR